VQRAVRKVIGCIRLVRSRRMPERQGKRGGGDAGMEGGVELT